MAAVSAFLGTLRLGEYDAPLHGLGADTVEELRVRRARARVLCRGYSCCLGGARRCDETVRAPVARARAPPQKVYVCTAPGACRTHRGGFAAAD